MTSHTYLKCLCDVLARPNTTLEKRLLNEFRVNRKEKELGKVPKWYGYFQKTILLTVQQKNSSDRSLVKRLIEIVIEVKKSSWACNTILSGLFRKNVLYPSSMK